MVPNRLDDPNFGIDLIAVGPVNDDFCYIAGDERDPNWRADQRRPGPAEYLLCSGICE